jgi:hypothetical protein
MSTERDVQRQRRASTPESGGLAANPPPPSMPAPADDYPTADDSQTPALPFERPQQAVAPATEAPAMAGQPQATGAAQQQQQQMGSAAGGAGGAGGGIEVNMLQQLMAGFANGNMASSGMPNGNMGGGVNAMTGGPGMAVGSGMGAGAGAGIAGGGGMGGMNGMPGGGGMGGMQPGGGATAGGTAGGGGGGLTEKLALQMALQNASTVRLATSCASAMPSSGQLLFILCALYHALTRSSCCLAGDDGAHERHGQHTGWTNLRCERHVWCERLPTGRCRGRRHRHESAHAGGSDSP